jgi:hypothetical protein
MVPVILPFMDLMSWEGTGERDDIWRKVCSYDSSFRKCTNKEDFIYGILGIMDVVIPDELPINKAIIEFRKELRKKGIFMGEEHGVDNRELTILGGINGEQTIMDGIFILGKLDNIATAGEFNPDVGILGYKKYGKILSKRTNLRKENYTERIIRNRYETEKFVVLLEEDYEIGHEICITKIGREKCTFKSKYMNLERGEIFEIVDDNVRQIGRVFRKRQHIRANIINRGSYFSIRL